MFYFKKLKCIGWFIVKADFKSFLCFYGIRKSLREMVERLVDKYEEVKEK